MEYDNLGHKFANNIQILYRQYETNFCIRNNQKQIDS